MLSAKISINTMKTRTLTRDYPGFTLLEIVIVLAIAALIMIIVFLAITGTQRSQRDQARKDGLNRVLSQGSSFTSNKNGKQLESTDLATFCTDYLNGGDNTVANGCVSVNGTPYTLELESNSTLVEGWTYGACTFGTDYVNQFQVGYRKNSVFAGRVCLETNSYYVAP